MAKFYTELRVKECPNSTHRKIERYISMVDVSQGRRLNKQSATVELLEKATKDIKL
jgi:hypothetical protein